MSNHYKNGSIRSPPHVIKSNVQRIIFLFITPSSSLNHCTTQSFLFPLSQSKKKYIHRMFSVGKKKHTLNSNVGFISCSLPAFLLKRLPRNAACFLRKFTVWHNRLSGTIIIKTPRDIGLTLSLMFPAAHKNSTDNFHALTFHLLRSTEHSNKLSSFNGFHTQKGLCAKRLWLFQKMNLSHFSMLSS